MNRLRGQHFVYLNHELGIGVLIKNSHLELQNCLAEHVMHVNQVQDEKNNNQVISNTEIRAKGV